MAGLVMIVILPVSERDKKLAGY